MSTEPSRLAPPFEVLVEFLASLVDIETENDHIVPVLRGSTLMKLWYGERARPAADIDLEWYVQPQWRSRFESPIRHAQTLCMFALDSRYAETIEFVDDVPVPGDGTNLWSYSTPGVRTYTGWTWSVRRRSGLLQIDLAQPAMVDLASVPTQIASLVRVNGMPTHIQGYSPEMLLAAKLSWIVRHCLCKPTLDRGDRLAFFGEPKDVFDAHLIVTQSELNAERFHKALLAVALEDKLDWNQLENFLDQDPALVSNESFFNWSSFQATAGDIVQAEPGDMLATIMVKVKELWSGYRQHVPFFKAIAQNTSDESNYLIYADWLEEREDWRAEFLRLFCADYFEGRQHLRAELTAMAKRVPIAWLAHALGSFAYARTLRATG